MAREKNVEKNKLPKGSQLESNKKAMTIQIRSVRVSTGNNGGMTAFYLEAS